MSRSGRRGSYSRRGFKRKRYNTGVPMRFRPMKRRRTNLNLARISGLLGIENKFIDYNFASAPLTSGWEVYDPVVNSLSGVVQDDGPEGRDGRMYTIGSIHIKGKFFFPPVIDSGAPTDDGIARLCLVLDTQTNGVKMTATDCMKINVGSEIFSFRNLENTKRFKVLWDKKFVIPAKNMNEGAPLKFAAGGTLRCFSINHRFKKGLVVRCAGTTAGVGNIKDNSLHIIAVTNQTDQIDLDYEVRTRFKG